MAFAGLSHPVYAWLIDPSFCPVPRYFFFTICLSTVFFYRFKIAHEKIIVKMTQETIKNI